MTLKSLKKQRQESVLYHAVSSYQLLAVLLHRLAVHPSCRAVLVLPDFIVGKYPQYRKLDQFFDRVYLFPYLKIPHGDEHQVLSDTAYAYRKYIPEQIKNFSSIYVAGAHFYFSLYLIRRSIPFTMMEDAAGMLSHPDALYSPLHKKFPLHAELARKYGLFDGSNPCIERVLCLKCAQTLDVSSARFENFCPEDLLSNLPESTRGDIIRFFLDAPIPTRAQAVLLTQHFANLGMMEPAEQEQLYRELAAHTLRHLRLIIKPHPDDTLNYAKIFPQAQIIHPVFPSELLPYVLIPKPEYLYTFDSAGCENLKKHFIIRKIERKNQDE